MLDQLLRSLFEIQILLVGELMSPTASQFSESMVEYYFIKYVYKYAYSPMVNDNFFS